MADDRTVIRIASRKRFLIIDTRAIEDSRLSWAARGLHAFLLAKPDDWEVRIGHLITCSPAGRDAVYRILQELERFSYLQRQQVRNEHGQITGLTYVVVEYPEQPHPDNPEPVKPGPDPLDRDFRPQLNKQSTNQEEVQKTTTEGDAVIGDLVFHNSLSKSERTVILSMLGCRTQTDMQALLDELTGAILQRRITTTPAQYMRGLVKQADAGKFVPVAGLRVVEDRRRRAAVETQVRASHELAAPPTTMSPEQAREALRSFGSRSRRNQDLD